MPNLHKWDLAQTPSCDRGQRQTMNHIVDTCPLTRYMSVNILSTVETSCTTNLSNKVTVDRLVVNSHDSSTIEVYEYKVKGKGSPYSITERKVPELITVLGSQPAGDVLS